MTTPRHADILVIGAGASGVVNSLALAEAGLRVVCLDQVAGPTRPITRMPAPTSSIAASPIGTRSRPFAAVPTITRCKAASHTR